MIQIRIGVRGQGKTARDVDLILQGFARGRGQATNFDLFLPGDAREYNWIRYRTLAELVELIQAGRLNGFDIHIDEIQHYMNSRQWKDLPPDMMMAICESRKHDIHVFGTVQYIQRLDIAVREQVDEIYVVQKFLFGICHETKWTRPFVDPNGEVLWEQEFLLGSYLHPMRWYRINKQIRETYNTLELISAPMKTFKLKKAWTI